MEKNQEKYGVPTTFRIPLEMKQKLVEQAKLKHVNLSQYLEELILQPMENSVKLQEDFQRVSKENEALKAEMNELKKVDFSVIKERKQIFDILARNESILKEVFEKYGSAAIDEKVLKTKGFNFLYATHKGYQHGNYYVGVFSYYYIKDNSTQIKVLKK